MEKKKVLITCTHSAFGGVAKYVIDLCEYLNKTEEFEAYIAIGNDSKDLTEEMKKVSKKLFIIPDLTRKIKIKKDIKAYKEIKEMLKRNNFDIVHSSGPKAGILFRYASYKLNIKNFYTHHLVVYKQFKSKLNPLYKLIEKKASKWCDGVFVVTESAKKTLIQDNVTPENKLTVIHNGIKDFETKYSKEEARKKLGLCDKDVIITSVGRLEEPKDPFTSLKALEKLSKTGINNYKFFFIGDGPLKESMQIYINNKKLEDRVIIKGFIRDVDLYLAASDFFVLSTTKEGLPIAVLEAMKYSLPIIANNVDGICEQIEENSNGNFFKVGDYDALYELLKKYIISDNLFLYGNNSKQLLIKNFNYYEKQKILLKKYREN